MKLNLCVLLVMTLLLRCIEVYALPADVEFDRLLLASETSFKKGEVAKAQDYIERAAALDSVDLPPAYYYLHGKILIEAGKSDLKAKELLEQYVTHADVQKGDERYQEVLGFLTEFEERTAAEQEAVTGKVKQPIDELVPSESYQQEIALLYLKPSYVEGLVTHVNVILDSYPYIGTRVSHLGDKGKRHQQLSVQKNELITMIDEQAAGLSSSRFSVYGMDPYVESACDERLIKCWVKHPSQSTEWLVIGYDRKAAEELTKAVSYLLREMQKR